MGIDIYLYLLEHDFLLWFIPDGRAEVKMLTYLYSSVYSIHHSIFTLLEEVEDVG